MEEEAVLGRRRRQGRATLCSVTLLVVCSVMAPEGAAMLDPGDFLALQSIRKALHDLPGSTFFALWDFTSDPCAFPGVLCSANRVVALSLGDPRAGSSGLSGRLDPDLGRLSALSELSLVPGRVVGPLPTAITQLTNLSFLALARNFLSGPIPQGFASLQQLGTLDLSFNQLEGTIPDSLAAIPTLSNLVLCHNHLSGSVPTFSSPSLRRLDLKHNNLTGGLPALPPSLQHLSLSWNQLSGPVDAVLPRLFRLSFLDLSKNQFTGPIPPCVFSFPITALQLQRNVFSGMVQPGAEVVIPAVDLSYNRLWGEVSPMLASVKRLYLNNNRFTGQVPARLVEGLQEGKVQVLYLQHNFLTGVEMGTPPEVPASSSLCLQYNCMVLPPVQMSCPLKAGHERTRPAAQCGEWRG